MAFEDFKQFAERDCAFRNSKGKARSAPALPTGVKIADTHCHLNMLPDPALALARAAHYGFGLLVCVVDPAEDSPESAGQPTASQSFELLGTWEEQAKGLLETWGEPESELPRVRFAVGVHPHNARNFEDARDELVSLLRDHRSSCIGEIGLDYHYDLSPRDAQREVFARQLRFAQHFGIPVELHLRDAHDDALDILRAEGVPQAGCVVHCFNLDAEVLAPFVELGCYISFGGPLTFRKAFYTRDACLQVPLDRLLTETDAPYMAPEPLRGTLCDPAQTVFTLRKMLDCFGYMGRDEALAALEPRQADIDAGARPLDPSAFDFDALQQGMDEAGFAKTLFDNAAGLLDRAPCAWQLS